MKLSTPLYGLLAEFHSPAEVVAAARRVKEEGYKKVDGYSPYPIEELSEALHFHHSPLPAMVLAGGIIGRHRPGVPFGGFARCRSVNWGGRGSSSGRRGLTMQFREAKALDGHLVVVETETAHYVGVAEVTREGITVRTGLSGRPPVI